jgi:hypothetical protein
LASLPGLAVDRLFLLCRLPLHHAFHILGLVQGVYPGPGALGEAAFLGGGGIGLGQRGLGGGVSWLQPASRAAKARGTRMDFMGISCCYG